MGEGDGLGDRALASTSDPARQLDDFVVVHGRACVGETRFGGAGHAWVGCLKAVDRRPKLEFEGRYQIDYYYTGQVLDPQTREETRVLLETFLMEKALYEIAYEANNRPDWLPIPAVGILELLESPP